MPIQSIDNRWTEAQYARMCIVHWWKVKWMEWMDGMMAWHSMAWAMASRKMDEGSKMRRTIFCIFDALLPRRCNYCQNNNNDNYIYMWRVESGDVQRGAKCNTIKTMQKAKLAVVLNVVCSKTDNEAGARDWERTRRRAKGDWHCSAFYLLLFTILLHNDFSWNENENKTIFAFLFFFALDLFSEEWTGKWCDEWWLFFNLLASLAYLYLKKIKIKKFKSLKLIFNYFWYFSVLTPPPRNFLKWVQKGSFMRGIQIWCRILRAIIPDQDFGKF
jgi:hypothetical protein